MTEEEECTISDEIFAILSKEQPTKRLPGTSPGTDRAEPHHASSACTPRRMWAARPMATTAVEGRLSV